MSTREVLSSTPRRAALTFVVPLCLALCVPAQVGPAAESDGGWSLSADQREAVNARGHPDSFTILGMAGNPAESAEVHRVETWHFHGDRLAVVFVDGDERGTKELDWPDLEPGPTTRFRPADFALGMTPRQVEARLGSDVELDLEVTTDWPEYHGTSYEQVQLGFEDGSLVYVDTSPDLPEDELGESR